ncbi:PA3496 family putative envelope integrity protein [Halomonas sp. WWR20]
MRNVEQVSTLKNQILDIFMSIEVDAHERRKKTAAQRYLRARRGIELHREFKHLERNIAALDDDIP